MPKGWNFFIVLTEDDFGENRIFFFEHSIRVKLLFFSVCEPEIF